MRLTMALTLCVTALAGITGCYIVEEDKPANSAPTAVTATASASAAPAPTQEMMRRAPLPPPLPDGG